MADAGRQVAFRQHGVISVAVDGLGQTQRDLSTIGKAGAQAHMGITQAGMQADKALRAKSKESFESLKTDMKAAGKVADEGRERALSALQATASVAPPEPSADFAAKFPDVAKEQSNQLNAMKTNMNEFRRSMAEAGHDVGEGVGMQDDIGASMGGDAEQRRQGVAIMDDMIAKTQKRRKELEGVLKVNKDNIKELRRQHKLKDREVKDAQLLRREAVRKHGIESKQYKQANSAVKKLEKERRNLNKQGEEAVRHQKFINQEIDMTNGKLDDMLDNKRKALNVDKSLSAVESKRRKDETTAHRDHKKRQSEIIQGSRDINNSLKTRRDLAIQFNRQVESMANSFKTTLVGAIAVSTAATTAFFNKLDGVRQQFQAFEEELMNAQSIFQANQDTLFGLSDQIVDFGNQYGISMQDASQGLYTLASAGLDANESMDVLNNTLKLSMAVQGDHETIAKLTTQTIFGFGLEMTDSAELTDKFAHSINKSLIEYQDLASAVKFAMPFFVSTGQSIDQLLGSLEILTNRALEAGIAGRGLRQALAEFAQHAEDNTAAFAKMGVEITNADGSFKQLTEIAKQFQQAMGPAASDVDLMTTLLEDLNVRGATAFVHLVQNADEFESAVNNLQNSAGSATAMADIQQQSLARSIQLIKNSLATPFLLSDEIGKANGHLNEFSLVLHNITEEFQGMIVVMEDGVATGLTPLGQMLKDFVIDSLREFHELTKLIVRVIQDMSDEGQDLASVIRLMTTPLKIALKIFSLLGPRLLEYVIMFKTLNAILPIQNMLMAFRLNLLDAEAEKTMIATLKNLKMGAGLNGLAVSYSNLMLSQLGSMAVMLAMVAATEKFAQGNKQLTMVIGALAGSFLGLAMAVQLYNAARSASYSGPAAFAMGAGLVLATAALFAGLNLKMAEVMSPPKVDYSYDEPTMDMGGRIMYDTGGPRGGGLGSRHQQVMVEPGETIIPKTQNMLSGGGGITLNIGGDIVTNDAEDFAQRIADVLPEALRRQDDMGGI